MNTKSRPAVFYASVGYFDPEEKNHWHEEEIESIDELKRRATAKWIADRAREKNG